MKNRFSKILKNLLGMFLFYSFFFGLGYITYLIFLPEIELSFKNLIGMYIILFQVSVLISVTTSKNE
jgi:hypothetical protein